MFWMLHVSTYSLRFFSVCCDLLDACTLENRQTIVFKFSRNYGAFLGENYFKFPTKYMKFPIFVGNLKNVPCVTFPLFSDKIKKKEEDIFGKHSCRCHFSRKLKIKKH